jgi:quercetin dioxygenase-like cupin family protein
MHATYAVAGGSHVTLLLTRDETEGALDVIEVLAQPGGGPPAHRHAFGEWFEVREGELTICEERDAAIVPTHTLTAGESLWVPPWEYHAAINLSHAPVRFRVTGTPGAVTGYVAAAGVLVPDELATPARTPPDPAELAGIASRWGIEFW